MSEELWSLPSSWKWTLAGEIAEIVGGGTPPTNDFSNFADNGIPWITPADLTGYEDTYIKRGRRGLSKKGLASCGARLMAPGTVLYSSRAPIGYCVIAADKISTNQGFKSLVLHDGIIPEYIRYYLISAKEYAESIASGTTFKEISGSRMATITIPLAPSQEQRRIVNKLDGLFERSRQAREELAHVGKLVVRYKEETLASAFRGELTSDWRKLNPGERIDPTTVLKLRTDVAGTIDDKDSPHKIPASWVWTLLNNVCARITDGEHLTPRTTSQGIPLLSAKDVRDGFLDISESKFVSRETANKSRARCNPEQGDVLVVSRGATVGRSCTVAIDTTFCLMGSVLLFKPNKNLVISQLVEFYFKSPIGLTTLISRSGSTAQQAIYIKDMRKFPIPVPPLAEQQEMVRRIESAFAYIDRLTTEAWRAISLLDRLDQSIVKKAFRGELVAQASEDEPAAALLERIRARAPQRTH